MLEIFACLFFIPQLKVLLLLGRVMMLMLRVNTSVFFSQTRFVITFICFSETTLLSIGIPCYFQCFYAFQGKVGALIFPAS